MIDEICMTAVLPDQATILCQSSLYFRLNLPDTFDLTAL
jgi:hypothetical protein